MNHEDVLELEARLRERRKTLAADLRAYLHGSGDSEKLELANHLEEVGNWVEASVFNDRDIAILKHELAELRDIDAALLRIDAGGYGVCGECGEAISAERMRASPTALYCLACQENFEKRLGHALHFTY